MTAQEHDKFFLDDEFYDISDVNANDNELFVPEKYGLEPFSLRTSNWRGYVATYGIQDDMLVLKHFSIGLNTKGDEKFDHNIGPLINGYKPSKVETYGDISNYFYENLNLPIKFTGGILACKGFIPELYVHMGFHPAWKFEKVVELLFDKGKTTERHDISDKMKEIRDKNVKKGLFLRGVLSKFNILMTFFRKYI